MTADKPRVQLAKPVIGSAEEEAVLEVLRSGMLVQGKHVARFEEELARRTGRVHAVAVTNGTTALLLALRALGVGPGDQVLCPDLTWPSPAHAILTLGATPVFVDVDPHSWNVTPAAMAAARTGATTAAVVIDQFGNPAPTPAIAKALPGIPIVVDAACSLGSSLAGQPAGSFGDVACMSFHPRKVITTGEGGVCLTDAAELLERLRPMRNHGQCGPGDFTVPSGNYRLDEISAAIGCVQLTRLQAMLDERRTLAERYRAELPQALRRQETVANARTNYQTFGVVLPDGFDACGRDRVVQGLRERGIDSGRLSFALHALPHLDEYATAACPESRAIADRGLALPLFHGMGDEAQTRVIENLVAVLTLEST